MRSSTRASQSGFSLIELIVALAVTMLIMAGTFSAMTQAMKSHETAKLVTGMNSNLRVAMDILIRDLLQTAQGLPTSKRIEVPNGLGAQAILRPGPTSGATFVASPSLPAISYGPNLGPTVDGHATDLITILLADAAVTNVPLRRITTSGTGFRLTVALPAIAGGVNITDGGVDDLRVGDLIMLQRGSDTTLMYVSTLVGGGNPQDITMVTGDPLRLNQFDPDDGDPLTEEMGGTLNQVLAALPAEPTTVGNNADGTPRTCQTRLSRVTMITYYVAPTADPSNPALMRIVNAGTANAIGFGLDDFKITYDLVADGVSTPPTNLRLVAADLAPSGPCGPDPCTENQIRKVNVTLAGRSRNVSTINRRYFRNTLFSQVSIRNLAFVDEY